MAKKSNKTAHVLSLLTNGQGTLDDDIVVEEKPSKPKSTKTAVVEEPQNVVEDYAVEGSIVSESNYEDPTHEQAVVHEQATQSAIQYDEPSAVVQPVAQPTPQVSPQVAPQYTATQVDANSPITEQPVNQQHAAAPQSSVSYEQQPPQQPQTQVSYEQSYPHPASQAPASEAYYQPQMPQASYEASTLHPQAVQIPSNPGFSKTAQMAQFANYESQIMTPGEISAIPNLMHAMPVQKPEVVVQMQSSDESVALADLVKADLEKALEKQIQERLEADANQRNYDENDRPPYSATFLAKFGDNLKQIQKAREAAKQDDSLSDELKVALEQNLEQELEQSIVANLEQELSQNITNVNSLPAAENKVDPFASPILEDIEEEEKEPTYESVKKEAYIWESFDFDDEDDDEDTNDGVEDTPPVDIFVNETIINSTQPEPEVLKSAEDFLNPHFSGSIDTKEETMGTEYTAINSPSIKDAEDAKKVVIRNLAEELVKAKAPEIMKSMNMCTCPACVLDVVALTLNHTQPLYVSTEKGELFSKLTSCEVQYGTDLASEITKACIKIKLNPRHPAVE